MKKLISLFILCLILAGLQNSYGITFNQRNILLGERAAMMGGAFTAQASDISASYYNPAGLVFLQKPSISLNANVYSYQYMVRESDMDFIPDLKFKRFNSIPTTFGISFNPSGSIVMALSIYTKDYAKFSTLDVKGDVIRKNEIDIENYLMGPSFAYKITDTVSVGTSIFFHYFQGKFEAYSDDGGGITQNTHNQVASNGIVPMIGFKWDITSNIKTGITYSFETIHIDGTNTYSDSNTAQHGETKGDLRFPHRISAGIAYEKPGIYTIAFDFIYYFQLEYDAPHEITRTDIADNVHKEVNHFDISLGGELFLTKSVALRLGIFTNTSGASDYNASERYNLYGGSVGFGLITGDVSSGIGIIGSYASSDFQQSTGKSESARWTRFDIGIVLGSTVNF